MTNYVTTESLYDLLTQEDISLEYMPLKKLDGFYMQIPEANCRVIGIREDITEYQVTYRSVLAEEIGHHFTNPVNKEPSRYLTPSGRIELEKSESAALRWAADFLIPDGMLFKCLSVQNSFSIEGLSESFLVAEYLMLQKFTTLSRKHTAYTLENGAQLILSNLPSIYIFNSINSFEC